jgi:Zn-finger nucleic acid-binding protein
MKPYQPKTGERCACRKGVERDNCPQCEGTGMRIDFAAIRARNEKPRSALDYPEIHKAGVSRKGDKP